MGDSSDDAVGFGELWQRHAGDVYRFALALGRRPDLAEEIVSETFVRAFTAPEPVRAGTVKAYLFAIARNLFLRGLDRERRSQPLDETLPDGGRNPEEAAALRSELAAVLAAAESLLHEADRAALLLRAEGLPYAQIARALGITETAAKVKVHRARVKLARVRRGER